MIVHAAHYEKGEDGQVVCRLCPANCALVPGQTGICRSRFNRDGELVTDNYGELVTLAVDPIEKKPLYHFYPGSVILSTGPNCCNLGCTHCQNWTISQQKTNTTSLSPTQLADMAGDYGSIGVAFTYTEPLIWFEYIRDVAPLLREAGKKVVLVTNGYLNPEPMKELLPLVDAMNVDLKGMREDFYRRVCKGKIGPVLDNIRQVWESGVHLEVTNLLIPEENDSDEDITSLIDFVSSISMRIPLHFSAYRPDFKSQRPPTPAAALLRARELAIGRLQYVYLGNLRLPQGNDTLCPGCGAILVERSDMSASVKDLRGGQCDRCGYDTGIRI